MIDLAHIHPMLVHFPIVLLLLGVGLEFLVMARGRDPAAHECLPNTALATLLLGALAAIVTAIFGEIAAGIAVAHGFPKAPIEVHEGFGLTTMWWFIVLSLLYLLAWWRRYPLAGAKGWWLFIAGLIGAVLVILTAYHGGHLVYDIGVNIHGVTPAGGGG